MRLLHEKVRELARERGSSLSELLRRAGVSRTAYYSLTRRPSVLPRSVRALASELDVPESAVLEDVPPRVALARMICEREPEASFDNVWHALTLLEMDPIDRLNRSLTRGRAGTVR